MGKHIMSIHSVQNHFLSEGPKKLLNPRLIEGIREAAKKSSSTSGHATKTLPIELVPIGADKIT